MIPLAEMLHRIEQEHGLKLYSNNLVYRKGADRPSIMQQLEAEGLAKLETRGQRGFWKVSEAAAARLIQFHGNARPGRPPGEQVSLWTMEQVEQFLALATSADPDVLRAAVQRATGLPAESLAEMQRIVIPIQPRR